MDIIDNMLQFGMIGPDNTYLITFSDGSTRTGKIDFDRRIDSFFVLNEGAVSVGIDTRHVRSIEETGSLDDYLNDSINT